MQKSGLIPAIVICLVGSAASSVLADLSITNVGDNPFGGFPNTGGSGSFNGGNVLKVFTSLGDVPIILHSTPSSGVDTLHIDERVTNHTGVTWTDFHLSFGSIDANPDLKVEFLNITNPTGQWTTIQSGIGFINLFGSVANNDTFSLSFELKATSQQGSFDLFGIHERPTIPSPSASVLAMLGCSILGAISRPRGGRLSALV